MCKCSQLVGQHQPAVVNDKNALTGRIQISIRTRLGDNFDDSAPMFTARRRGWLFLGRGLYDVTSVPGLMLLPGGVLPPGGGMVGRHSSQSHKSGRYVSYCSSFLFLSISVAFFWKIWRPLLERWRPSHGESWIRLCISTLVERIAY